MCRFRVSLWQAEQLAIGCRNIVWNEQPLTESQSLRLLNAVEDLVSDMRSLRRKRWRRRWNLALRMDADPRRRRQRLAAPAAPRAPDAAVP